MYPWLSYQTVVGQHSRVGSCWMPPTVMPTYTFYREHEREGLDRHSMQWVCALSDEREMRIYPYCWLAQFLHASQSMNISRVWRYLFSIQLASKCKPAATSSDQQKEKQSVLMLERKPIGVDLLWDHMTVFSGTSYGIFKNNIDHWKFLPHILI